MFQCEQSLQYHKLSKHTENPPLSHICGVCEKSFLSKVTLNNHIKYKHSDIRMFECTECDSTFKQKKNLNVHSINVHGKNPRKEDYWQDLKRKKNKCETCGAIFNRPSNLKVHNKVHYEDHDRYTCGKCSSNFKYEKSLKRHEVEKHGPEESKFDCPTCGSRFTRIYNFLVHSFSDFERQY